MTDKEFRGMDRHALRNKVGAVEKQRGEWKGNYYTSLENAKLNNDRIELLELFAINVEEAFRDELSLELRKQFIELMKTNKGYG
jgi:chemotaxis methyl-accepting protein methylase